MSSPALYTIVSFVCFSAASFVGVCVPLGEIDIGLLADQVGVTAPDTLDPGQGVHDVLLAIDVGVQQPQDVLEVRLLACHERYIPNSR